MLRRSMQAEGERLYDLLEAAWRRLLLTADWEALAAIHQRLLRLEALGIGPQEDEEQ